MAKLGTFRKKLEAKRIVRYWEDSNELAEAVKDSVNDIVRRRPGVGWVRGDQALDPKVYKDLEQLRRENERLAKRIQEIEGGEVRFPEELSHGDDVLTLEYQVYQKNRSSPYSGGGKYLGIRKYDVTWNNLFIALANSLYGEHSEYQSKIE
jgi:hypothetical protein